MVSDLGRDYDEARHGLSDAGHATQLADDFIDRFAVVGSPEECVRRLRELIDLGLDRIVVVAGSRDSDPAMLRESNEQFARHVLAALK